MGDRVPRLALGFLGILLVLRQPGSQRSHGRKLAGVGLRHRRLAVHALRRGLQLAKKIPPQPLARRRPVLDAGPYLAGHAQFAFDLLSFRRTVRRPGRDGVDDRAACGLGQRRVRPDHATVSPPIADDPSECRGHVSAGRGSLPATPPDRRRGHPQEMRRFI